MEDLNTYEQIALKIISNWRKRKGKLIITDDLLGRVIRFLAVADWKYDEAKSKGLSLYQYRQMRGIYAIREYLKEAKLRRKYEDVNMYCFWNEVADYDEKLGRKLKFLIRNAGLNKDEKNVIDNALAGFDVSQTAERLGINYDKCANIYNRSISKIQRIINHVE